MASTVVDMLAAALYVRISQDRAGDEALALSDNARNCQKLAVARGWDTRRDLHRRRPFGVLRQATTRLRIDDGPDLGAGKVQSDRRLAPGSVAPIAEGARALH